MNAIRFFFHYSCCEVSYHLFAHMKKTTQQESVLRGKRRNIVKEEEEDESTRSNTLALVRQFSFIYSIPSPYSLSIPAIGNQQGRNKSFSQGEDLFIG